MKNEQKILNLLWKYTDIFNLYATDDEKKTLSVVAKKSSDLKKSLSDNQYLVFEDYQNSLLELCSVEKKEAFIRGVKFAAGFIFEALNND